MDIKEYNKVMNERYFRNNAYHGVKDPQENSTSGNHHIINAIHYTILNREGELTEQDREIADKYIEACMERPGIFNRAPDKFDHQAHDDYIGIACTSSLLSLPFIGYINDNKLRYYDNTEESIKFEFKNWHGRFPWAIMTYRVCGGLSVNILLQLAFCIYLYINIGNKDLTDTSGKILRWLQIEAVKGKYKLVDYFIKMWHTDVMKDYPGGMGDVMGIYYGEDHPFAKVLKGKV